MSVEIIITVGPINCAFMSLAVVFLLRVNYTCQASSVSVLFSLLTPQSEEAYAKHRYREAQENSARATKCAVLGIVVGTVLSVLILGIAIAALCLQVLAYSEETVS